MPAAIASRVLPVPALPISVTSFTRSSSKASKREVLLAIAWFDAPHAFAGISNRDELFAGGIDLRERGALRGFPSSDTVQYSFG